MRKVPRYTDKYKREKRRRFSQKVFFIIGILVVLLAGIIYLLFFAHLLDVRSVVVESDTQASELKDTIKVETNQWLDGKKYFLQRRRNIVFLGLGQLQVQLTKDFPKIDSISISRQLFHEIKINIKERSPAGIWCLTTSQQCFYFNKAGIAYEKSPQTSGFLILAVQDDREREINFGDKVTDNDWLKAIVSAQQQLSDKKIQVKFIGISKNSINDFYALTSANFKILLSIDTDIASQIDAMVSFISQKLTADRVARLQYIDLRIQDRIYYK